MTCRAPLEAVRAVGADKFKPIVYKAGRRPAVLAKGFEAIDLPCGQCASCRLEYSRVWAVRLMHEAAWWEEHYRVFPFFFTLTYDEEHLPLYGMLVKHHVQDFLKRLRANTGAKIRYYVVGEYGSQCPDHQIIDCPVCGPIQRPHYHGILFGWAPDDKKMMGHRDGGTVYTSDEFGKAWPFGSHELGSCTFESCAYVARYIMKKQNGARAEDHYCKYFPLVDLFVDMPPEFALMSRGGRCPGGQHMGGIGRVFYEAFKSDMYPSDETPVPGRGCIGKPPRYYDRLYEAERPAVFAGVKEERIEAMRRSLEDGPSLRSRAMVEDARLKMLRRT